MTRTIALRAAAVVVVAVAAIVGLTLYFSSQTVPPCLRTGIPEWRAPTGEAEHRFELVVPDRALCFFDMDHDQELAGYVKLPGIKGITAIAPRGAGSLALRYGGDKGALVDLTTRRIEYDVRPPRPPSDSVVVEDPSADVEYVTRPGELGFRVYRLDTHRLVDVVKFEGFTWNPQFGPNPPDHGLSLAPDRPELWVLDAPNSVVHVFDVSGALPDRLVDIRLTKPLAGDESPCASHACGRIGSLQHSADGRFVYVGDAGDVIDTRTREEVANLEALHNSRLTIEVDWAGGHPTFPASGSR